MRTKEQKVQRSVSVPAEIDQLALRLQEGDPDMTYSQALRKILRAGVAAIEETDLVRSDGAASKTQLSPQFAGRKSGARS